MIPEADDLLVFAAFGLAVAGLLGVLLPGLALIAGCTGLQAVGWGMAGAAVGFVGGCRVAHGVVYGFNEKGRQR